MTDACFEGRTALVTGGARGIGRTICERLACHGARVAVNYRTSQRGAEETVRAIASAGGNAIAVRADVSDGEQVTAMVRVVTDQLGPIDLLVNNAAVFRRTPVSAVTPEAWDEFLELNLRSAFFCSQAAARAIGYPILVKAVSGGGGKGMRTVLDPADLSALASGIRNAMRS